MHIFRQNINTNVPCEQYYVFILFWNLNNLSLFFILTVNCNFLLLLKDRQEEKKHILPAS